MKPECLPNVLHEINYIAIGKRIRHTRKQLHMTQEDLGKAAGLSVSFCGHIERGTRKASIETIIHIAAVLDVSLDILLTGKHKIDVEVLTAERKKQTIDDITKILDKHSDEWIPTLQLGEETS